MSQSNVDYLGTKGVTAQVFPRHPDISTAFLWGHNLLENEPTTLAEFDYQPKPAGWGNLGGGVEPGDLQWLSKNFPDHPILFDRKLTGSQRLIIAGGIREFISESGYIDFDIITDYPGVFLYDYTYRDRVDAKGVYHPGGHRKVTLWGQMRSFRGASHQVYEEYHIEKHEVDRTDWFDAAEPLARYFFNPVRYPDQPYYAHLVPTLAGLLRIYGYLKANTDDIVPDIPSRIHPSWWYIFRIGKGDDRFPVDGYKMEYWEWYNLFRYMVDHRLEQVDTDFLYKFCQNGIEKKKEKAKRKADSVEEEKDLPIITEDQDNTDGILTPQEVMERDDLEYARWFETDLSENMRVVKH